MKINQVEELVDISKKNIRFYEDQGLLNPSRNPENGYREYSLKDVDELYKIKFLRKLAVPLEDIRQVQKKEITLSQCFEKQSSNLKKEIHSLEAAYELCDSIKEKNLEYSDFKAEEYLEEIRNLEKGGKTFMDVSNTDVKKKKNGALIAAIVFSLLIISYLLLVGIAGIPDGMPISMMILIGSIGAIVIIGCIVALIQRFKEIEGGEEDEASKY
ncbi:MAG: MerR family transcriptional regulator [Lachnospiraceae bacterium]|jgi:DNA-binding transcriptional MerR regulator|nr:MerR family transcriptional regulator [Lachnospiraceae bacterium]